MEDQNQEVQPLDELEFEPETSLEESFDEEQARHQAKLNELARNSPYFVQCDEETFPLNDDGSERMHGRDEVKQESEPAAGDEEMQLDPASDEMSEEGDEDTYTYAEDEEEEV